MKLWYQEQKFPQEHFAIKTEPFVPSAYAQMSHFEAWSGVRYQLSHI